MNILNFQSKNIITFLLIGVVSLSIFVCSYMPLGLLDAQHSGHTSFSTSHIDHARSLNLAVIPTIICISVSFIFLSFFFSRKGFNADIQILSKYFSNYYSPPPNKEIIYSQSKPRSPPVY